MKKERLIEHLEKFPEGAEIAIFDWRKNLSEDCGEGSSEGIYFEFEFEYQKTEKPLVTLNFNNPDYNDEGMLEER